MSPVRLPPWLQPAAAEVKAARLAICRACPSLVVATVLGKKIERCGQCGCPLASKTHSQGAKCPLSKW